MVYSEKLKDPRWQKKRLEILNRDDFCCQKCRDREHTLHVHHKYYLHKAEPWDYPAEALITYCFDCHEEEEQMKGLPQFFLHELYKVGFSFGSFQDPYPYIFSDAVKNLGFKQFDYLIHRLSLSEIFREEINEVIERERLRRESKMISDALSNDDLPWDQYP